MMASWFRLSNRWTEMRNKYPLPGTWFRRLIVGEALFLLLSFPEYRDRNYINRQPERREARAGY